MPTDNDSEKNSIVERFYKETRIERKVIFVIGQVLVVVAVVFFAILVVQQLI